MVVVEKIMEINNFIREGIIMKEKRKNVKEIILERRCFRMLKNVVSKFACSVLCLLMVLFLSVGTARATSLTNTAFRYG